MAVILACRSALRAPALDEAWVEHRRFPVRAGVLGLGLRLGVQQADPQLGVQLPPRDLGDTLLQRLDFVVRDPRQRSGPAHASTPSVPDRMASRRVNESSREVASSLSWRKNSSMAGFS